MFLRLRKAARAGRLAVYSLAALASPGLSQLSGTLLPTVPGEEAEALGARWPAAAAWMRPGPRAAHALRQPGAVILAGERLAEVPGALSAAARLAQATGARLAWIPRRAGERGAIEAGALPVVLPGGRAVTDPAARAEVARAWGVASLPRRARPGHGADPGRRGGRGDRRAGRRRRRPGRPARPGGGAGGARGRAVRGQPGAAGQRGDRPRGRGAAGRRRRPRRPARS